MKRGKISTVLYVLVLFFLLAILFVPGVSQKLKDLFLPVATIEKAVNLSPDDMDLELKGINTPDANLKDLNSKPLIFLNFWGTWCPPCREEWPSIQKLYESPQSQKTTFVLIAMQDQEVKVREFLEKNHYTVPVYIAQSPISENILPKVFPTTFLMSKDGRILLKEDSTKDWNSKSMHEFFDNVTK